MDGWTGFGASGIVNLLINRGKSNIDRCRGKCCAISTRTRRTRDGSTPERMDLHITDVLLPGTTTRTIKPGGGRCLQHRRHVHVGVVPCCAVCESERGRMRQTRKSGLRGTSGLGAGTSGCVIASRLSKMPNVTVLLVEAGGYFGWLSTMPLLAPMMQGTEVDWAYQTEPQVFSSRGLYGYRQNYPRGRGLGGSGQLNYLVHSFGRPEDYKRWPKGWSHADLLPYFQKVSDIMNVSPMPEEEYLTKAFVLAEESLKLDNISLRKAMYTAKKGSRWSTLHAYLRKAWNRKNLHILMNTLVAKVLFKNDKADGIKVIYKDGSVGKIGVRKEVILCAGAINTPQLLLISGIGPASELNKHKVINENIIVRLFNFKSDKYDLQIPVVRDLSQVGRNLFDHLNVPVYVNLRERVSITLVKLQTVSEVFNYFAFGTGWLATNGVMGLGRANNSGLLLFGVASAEEKLLKAISNFETETYRSLFPSYNDSMHEGFIYLVTCLQPKSRGSITLRSSNIRDPPKINPAYLQDPDDITCTYRAINFALDTLDTRLFREYGAKVHIPDFEECRHLRQDYRDIDYSECVMRISGLTSYHPCGTCRLGADDNAVVDEELRIKGVSGLRIMDASVVPSPISGNPNSVLVAMAERASDIILDWSSKLKAN
ncbi:neither inactivation nor afterpotential protein G isoform X4 [Monomorium pharaonis]|uniref:neither inactivation nor afterpotential protein G isoform X4 n=1 Tax=Monomorium pharaonis TaxID=307658 RepID=UPI001746DF74|nr:neither inactivation nor afterpotential protein G isoform X4 [Monomorium pharaonis]